MSVKNRLWRFIIAVMTITGLGAVAACAPGETKPSILDVYVLDVGKADSILIQFDAQWMIVDAGLEETSQFVIDTMRELGVSSLLYAVATHPDKDHIGGMAAVLAAFPTRTFIEPPFRLDNRSSRVMRLALSQLGIPSNAMRAGDGMTIGALSINVLAPGDMALSYDDANEASVVLMLGFGRTRILLMGDAKSGSEAEILSGNDDLRADVIKVGHHGSDDATSAAFLQAARPSVAVISTGDRVDGKDAKKLPSAATLARLEDIGAKVYRTDLDGTIHIRSDGVNVTVNPLSLERPLNR